MAGQDLEGRCLGLLSLDCLVQWGGQGPQELHVLQAPVSFPHTAAGIGEALGLLKPGPGNPGSFPAPGWGASGPEPARDRLSEALALLPRKPPGTKHSKK